MLGWKTRARSCAVNTSNLATAVWVYMQSANEGWLPFQPLHSTAIGIEPMCARDNLRRRNAGTHIEGGQSSSRSAARPLAGANLRPPPAKLHVAAEGVEA